MRNTIRSAWMTICSSNLRLRLCRCPVVYALAKILASVTVVLSCTASRWRSCFSFFACTAARPGARAQKGIFSDDYYYYYYNYYYYYYYYYYDNYYYW